MSSAGSGFQRPNAKFGNCRVPGPPGISRAMNVISTVKCTSDSVVSFNLMFFFLPILAHLLGNVRETLLYPLFLCFPFCQFWHICWEMYVRLFELGNKLLSDIRVFFVYELENQMLIKLEAFINLLYESNAKK